MASGSEDEKHLKKAREVASRKRRQRVLGCIGAPNFALTTIEKGYKLSFAGLPLVVRLQNMSARLHADFVHQAVLEFVNSGRVCTVFKQPFIVNPLSVSIQPCGKKSLILDLRHVNRSLIKQRTKYED